MIRKQKYFGKFYIIAISTFFIIQYLNCRFALAQNPELNELSWKIWNEDISLKENSGEIKDTIELNSFLAQTSISLKEDSIGYRHDSIQADLLCLTFKDIKLACFISSIASKDVLKINIKNNVISFYEPLKMETTYYFFFLTVLKNTKDDYSFDSTNYFSIKIKSK